jgi:hypothetical protein
MKKILVFLSVLFSVMWTDYSLARPLTLYRVELIPGVDAYRHASSQNWEVYYLLDNILLVAGRKDQQNDLCIKSRAKVYSGDSESLKWAFIKRGYEGSQPPNGVIFSDRQCFLLDDRESKSYAKGLTAFKIKRFSDTPMQFISANIIPSKSLTRDSSIALLANMVDTAMVRADVESLQAFNTRSTVAPNHEQVVEWIRDEFISYGIADVVIDSFLDPGFTSYTQYYFGNNDTHKIRNVVATIPGLVDTGSIYIVGGHFDTSVWPYNPWAPGADDNGSGTTAVLQTAKILASNHPNTTVKLIALDCEEWGLYGAEHYASMALSQGLKVQCMINYDMIGSIGNDSVFVSKVYPGSESYAYLLGQMADWYGRTANVNLVPTYNSVYLNGSDSWEFYLRGFPVTYSEEYSFSPVYHQTNDSTSYMNMRYCTSIIKAGVGLLATLANYPQKVEDVTVCDIGTGTDLLIQWSPNMASNIVGYDVCYGLVSQAYSDTSYVSGGSSQQDTINGLLSDSTYYIIVNAVDDKGNKSCFATEVTGTPKLIPLSPSAIKATPVVGGLSIYWAKNKELDIDHYSLYRKINDGLFDSLTSLPDTCYIDTILSGAEKYYYKVRAFDHDGNYSPMSDSVYGRPITLDQGVLLVDETNNWTSGSFPRDAQQDSFYEYILSDYKHQPYDYGTATQKPILADLGPYSAVVWLADDYVTMLASGAMNDIRSYLGYGGKVWFAGWKPSQNIRNSTLYPDSFETGEVMYDCFGIGKVELSGSSDSVKQLIGLSGYPDIAVDTLKYPSSVWGKTFRSVEAVVPAGEFDTIYSIDLKNNGSAFEGRACAVRDSGRVVYFGFPVYFMDREDARLAAQRVMAEFGEPNGVAERKPEMTIPSFKLYQNAPNPFSRQTNISYQLSKPGRIKLSVYNIAGQLVKTIVNGEQQAGSYVVKWDRRDHNNKQVSAGIYIYQLNVGDKMQSRKMIVLK